MKKAFMFWCGIALVLVIIGLQTGVFSKVSDGGLAQVITSLNDSLTKINQMQADMNSLLSQIKTGIIVDNADVSGVTRIGIWEKATQVKEYYGPDYEFLKGTTGSFTFSPTISRPGTYEVFTRWTAGTVRASIVPIDIIPDGSIATTVYIDQKSNGGHWTSLGNFNFPTGKNSKVVFNVRGSNGYVIADAVRFDFRAPAVAVQTPVTTTPNTRPTATSPTTSPTPANYADIIMDNTASGVITRGPWTTSTYISGFYGSNYFIGATADGSTNVTFTPNLPVAGTYKVYTRWTGAWAARDPEVPVEITHKLGKTTTFVDQTKDGTTWQLLGTFSFNAGTAGKATILIAGTTGDVIADAVRFLQVDGSTTLTPINSANITSTPTPAATPATTPVTSPRPTPVTVTSPVVSTNGSLPANTIIVNPGQSIQNAIDNAPDGATIAIHGGTYNGKIKITKTLTLKNYPGETPILNGGASDQSATVWFYESDTSSAKNSIVSGLEITGGYYGIKIDGGEYRPGINNGIIVENCKIHDVGYDGIKITFNANNIIIRNNEVYRTGRDGTNAQGIDTVGTDNILIQGNYVHDTVSDGLFTKGGSVGAIIENNRVVNAGTGGEGNGIDAGMSGTDANVFNLSTNSGMNECINCIIRNNTVTNVANSGITVNGSKNTIVENNTVSGFKTAGIRIAAVENWPDTGGYLQIPNINITLTGNKIKSSGANNVLIINTSLGAGLTGSFTGSNNTYYNTAGAVSLRDDTKSFTGGLTAWQQIRNDVGSKEVAF